MPAVFIGNHELLNMDCLEALKGFPDNCIDFMVQDPPYGITQCAWDISIVPMLPILWSEWLRILKPDGVLAFTSVQPFTSHLILSNLDMFKYEWVWRKSYITNVLNCNRQPVRNHENVVIFYNGGASTYNPQGLQPCNIKTARGVAKSGKSSATVGQIGGEYGYYERKFTNYPRTVLDIPNSGDRSHPSQKPVELLEYLVRTYSNPGDVVFDGYMGSGTAGRACERTDRNFIGCEIDPIYFQVSVDAISKECNANIS